MSTNTSTDRIAPQPAPADLSNGSRRHRVGAAAGLLALLLSSIAVGLTATPASAATPRCDNWARVTSGADAPQMELYLPASGGGWGTWKCLSQPGDHNPAVSELQRGLNYCYGNARGANLGISLTVDGEFGPATKAALVKVQKFHHIYADGIYGPQTAATIWHRGLVRSPYGYFIACLTTTDAGLH